jgi:CheY-like chemotaxis protein
MAILVVVDDESLVTDSLSFLLENEGHTVHAASNGKEALELIARVRPALVITDLMMPAMSGLELAAALQQGGNAVPVVLCSAVPHAVPPQETHRFAAMLRKPCEASALIDAVARFARVRKPADEH